MMLLSKMGLKIKISATIIAIIKYSLRIGRHFEIRYKKLNPTFVL